MSVFYLNISKKLALKVVPETRVYMDGHPILTYSYSLYRDDQDDIDTLFTQDEQKKQSDPNYLGYVTFEIPGWVFHYVSDGKESLNAEDVEQVVEQITYFRDRPDLWNKVHLQ
jgi:uncharacterized protein YcgL (UPF0745 family)